MKRKTQATQANRHSIPAQFRYFGTPLVMGFCLIQSATAAITTWSGTGGDDNWSTAGNWISALPAGNDVVFAATDATGTKGDGGTPNSIVSANTSISTLRYTNLETTGNHTTEITAGATLTIVGGDAVSTTAAKPSLFVSSPTTASTDVVYATLLGDGNLFLNNALANMHVGQGTVSTTGHPDNVASTTRRATLDMSGLNQFEANLGRIIVGQQTVVGHRANGTILLAATNLISLNNTTLPGITLGDIGSNNGNSQIIELGITVGGRKGNGIIRFNSAMVAEGAGTATFRNLNGTGRQANWLIGDNSGQSGGGTFSTGVVDFSLYGGVDALVNVMILGRGTAGAATNATPSQGTLSFDKGIIDTNQLTLGIQTVLGAGGGQGTMNVDGTGNLTVNGNLTLGRFFGTNTATIHKALGLLNIGTISGGGAVTISGNVICGTGVGNKITLAAGSLTLGGKVGDDSVAGDAPLETLQLDGGTLAFNFGSAPNPAGSRVKVTNLNVPNPVSLSFTGSGLSPDLPDIELIKYTTFDEATQFANLSLAGLPTRVEAELVNNVANSSVDLNIISISTNKWSGEVSGVPNGNWDIDTTMNWKLAPANTPSTYLQVAVPGEPVTFDDTATGTKTVNLTTVLSPASITVETAATYTFNGAGTISGPTGISKRGGGSLVLQNSGSNDFTGAVNLEAGKIQIGSNDRLPVNATVTLSDVATAELDLNHFNQTLLSLNGGGTTGGNVQLGSGTLTVTGAGSYAGAINGGGALARSGTGNQVLTGASAFTGGTTISGGRITVANATGSGLGSGPVVIALGGELALGNGTDTGSIAATTITSDGLLIINRSDDTTLDKALIGTGGLTKTGEGTLLIDSAKTYGGITTISGGALLVTHKDALGTATAYATDGTNISNAVTARLELSGGITLAEPIQLAQKQSAAGDVPGLVNMDGNNTLTGPLTLGGGGSNWNIWSNAGKLTIAGPATNINTTNTRVIRFFGDGDGEISSNLANGAGASLTAVFMNGNGTWRLAGNNTYTGNTTVEFGTLQIDGTQTASTVIVNFSGTLSGSGTLGTVNATGIIAPGAGIGTLNAASVTLSGTLAIEASGASADRLTVSGALDLTGATVSVTGTPTAGSYILASAGTPITGVPVLADPVPNYELVVDGNLLKLNSLGGLSPYETWAGGAPFGGDANGDGVTNGLAFLLGAASPAESALNKLPTITQSGGGLLMTFSMRNPAARGTATLSLQHSSDLGIADAWTSVVVPDTTGGPFSGVNFSVTPGDPLNSVQATIESGQAASGKLFGRLQGQNP
jgi:fibronectin-binding autotransporter adhesin